MNRGVRGDLYSGWWGPGVRVVLDVMGGFLAGRWVGSGQEQSFGIDVQIVDKRTMLSNRWKPISKEAILSQDNLHLYVDAQFASPYAMSVFVALQEKELSFAMSTVDLGVGENFDLGYVTKSLTRRVPTLVHGDFALSESSAITEYLDETFAGVALYPKDGRLRAKARQVQAWLRSDLMPIRQERSTEVIFYGARSKSLTDAAKKAAQKLFFAAEALLSHGEEHLFTSWCIADVDLALMLQRLVLNGDEVPESLRKYAARQWERKSIQQWVKFDRPPL